MCIRDRPLTANTITDPERLRRELAAARLHGYAMDDGEIEEGLICMAAPICDKMCIRDRPETPLRCAAPFPPELPENVPDRSLTGCGN